MTGIRELGLGNNAELFSAQADELYAAINGDESHPLWPQAVNLANLIGSDNPLFMNNDDLAIESNSALDSSSDAALEKASDELDEIDSEEFGLPVISSSDEIDDSSSASSNSDWAPDQVTEFVARDEDTVLNTSIETTEDDISDIFDPTVLDVIDTDESSLPVIEDTVFEDTASENTTVIAEHNFDETELLSEEISSVVESDAVAVDVVTDVAIEPEAEISEPAIFETETSVIDDISDVDEVEIAESEAALSDEDLQKAMSAFTEEALAAVDADTEDKTASGIDAGDVFEDTVAEDASIEETTSVVKNEAFGDTSFFLLSDEVGTKLDLARAYIEMGDHEGASDLLNEVLSEGNQRQKLEAKALMDLATA